MIFKAYKEVTMTSFNIDEVMSSHRSCHCQCAMTTLYVISLHDYTPVLPAVRLLWYDSCRYRM